MLTKDLTTDRAQPRFIEPMYAEAVRELPNGHAWTYEAKLDGYRCLAMRRNGHSVLWSRRGTLFTLRFPEIACACEKLPPDTLIDGEVVAIGQDGRPSFNALQHSRRNAYLQFYALRRAHPSRPRRDALAAGDSSRVAPRCAPESCLSRAPLRTVQCQAC